MLDILKKYIKPILLLFALGGSITGIVFLVKRFTEINNIVNDKGYGWSGASHYYLWTCPDDYQHNVFKIMNENNIKVIRVFILSTQGEGYPGECNEISDIENTIGDYNNLTMSKINRFLHIASTHNVKVILALHDRWSLGCWRYDSYARKYNIQRGDPQKGCLFDNNAEVFYNDLQAKTDFKNRLRFILESYNPYMDKYVKDLTDVILTIQPQNEPQRGFVTPRNNDWICEMAGFIKLITKIPVSSGGGWESIYAPPVESHINDIVSCPYLDIITVHDYSTVTIAQVMVANSLAISLKYNKRLILEEFGKPIKDYVEMSMKYGVPWMFWSLTPSSIWVNTTDMEYISKKSLEFQKMKTPMYWF